MNIRELAARLKLSRSTVSLALRNSPEIAIATRRRVQHLAKKIGYCPNPAIAKVMSTIAQKNPTHLSTPIILLSDFPHAREWERSEHALGRFYRGVVSRARDLGYKIEELWMRAPGMTSRRIEQILAARGTEGVIVFNYPRAPAYLDVDLTPYACAVLGRALLRPRLYAVDQDHHQGMFLCLDHIKHYGYKRPALLLDASGNERSMHCSAAAYQFYVSQMPARSRIPYWVISDGDVARFRKWVCAYQPDVVITTYPGMANYINDAGYQVPDDFGLVTLFRDSATCNVAGIDICDESVAAAVVDLVVQQLRNHQKGPLLQGETMLFDPVWCDGPTLPTAAPKRRRAIGPRTSAAARQKL